MKMLACVAVVIATALPLSAASASNKDLLSAVAESGRTATFLKAVEAAGLADKMIAELFDPANKEELAGVLKSHFVPGRVTVSALDGKALSLETAAATGITIESHNGLRAANAKMVVSDVLASNGVIHVVDEVIEPVL